MRRRLPPDRVGPRPPIPERFRRIAGVAEFVDPAGGPDPCGAAAWSRWRAAANAWGAEHGYTSQEMFYARTEWRPAGYVEPPAPAGEA